MDFRPSPDQSAIIDAVDRIAGDFTAKPTDFHGFALHSAALDAELEANGFYDIAGIAELGPLTAELAVERLARLPWTAEIALSMLVRPHLPGDWPRPLAVVENGRPGRFVASAATLILVDGDSVSLAPTRPGDCEPVESILAYPMGRPTHALAAEPLAAADAGRVRTWLRVALAAEAAGLMQAAIDTTVEYLSVRKQFGRPLGSFQALRHRLAECAVLAGGVHLLAMKAAWSGDPGDAALAATHAQDSATRLCYEVHQMFGAMGMTLEASLHLWTYRLKALLSELGGRGAQSRAVAEHCFDAKS